MAETIPVVRLSDPRLVLLQLALFGLLVAAWFLVFGADMATLFASGVTYLVYAYSMRWMFARHHRAGMAALRANDWPAAIEHFRRAAEDLRIRPWVDRYRGLVMMSTSAAPERELAIANIAFALLQQGDAATARDAYEQVLDEFPDSVLAQTVLHTMDRGSVAGGAPKTRPE